MNDEARAAQSAMNAATAAIQKCPRGKGGFGAEAAYGAAYRRLVRLGLAPQLRGKYRA
jgi:hypothetical protein